MRDELKKYGSLGEDIHRDIYAAADELIDKKLSVVRVLKDFEDVDVLTFDEACKVLRLSPDELRNAVKSNYIPHTKAGKSIIQFPKPLLIDYLLGNWNRDEPQPRARVVKIEDKINSFVS